MISCIIIDDEPLAIKQLELYIKNTPILDLKASFDNALDALAFLRENTIDLLLVDINMPKITGLELVEAMPNKAKVIFITAYREYAFDGFDLDAADYLLKPLSYATFIKSIEKVNNRYFNKPSLDNSFIFVRSDYKSVRVDFNDILYIESKREYLNIMLESGKVVTTCGSLNNFLEKLPSSNFERVHRSFIVNLDKINVIERNCIVFGKLYIQMNEQAKEIVQKFLNNMNSTT